MTDRSDVLWSSACDSSCDQKGEAQASSFRHGSSSASHCVLPSVPCAASDLKLLNTQNILKTDDTWHLFSTQVTLWEWPTKLICYCRKNSWKLKHFKGIGWGNRMVRGPWMGGAGGQKICTAWTSCVPLHNGAITLTTSQLVLGGHWNQPWKPLLCMAWSHSFCFQMYLKYKNQSLAQMHRDAESIKHR